MCWAVLKPLVFFAFSFFYAAGTERLCHVHVPSLRRSFGTLAEPEIWSLVKLTGLGKKACLCREETWLCIGYMEGSSEESTRIKMKRLQQIGIGSVVL